MKYLIVNSFLCLALGASLLFSCTEQEEAAPAKEALPHYDESNTQAVTWDEMPAELKNAAPISAINDGINTEVNPYVYQLGPWGGNGGSTFQMIPPVGTKINAIAIRAGRLVDNITVWYRRSDGTVYVGGNQGGTGGTYYIQFFDDNEYITQVRGRSGRLVDQIGFVTNRKSFAYGGNGGTAFFSAVPAGYQILGFWGNSARLLDKIGFYVYRR